MKEAWIIARVTYALGVRSSTFLMLTFGLPLLMIASGGIVELQSRSGPIPRIGYVDQSGKLSPSAEVRIGGEVVRLNDFADVSAARSAQADGAIDAYLVVSAGYFQGEAVRYYGKEEPNRKTTAALEAFMRHSVLPGAPEQTIARLRSPLSNVTFVAADTGTEARDGFALGVRILLPFMLAGLFGFMVTTNSSQMGATMAREKDQRAIEIVLTSLAAWKLVAGKIVAVTLLSLTQVGVWAIGGGLALAWAMSLWASGEPINIPLDVLGWAFALFLPGYFLYAALAAGVGLLASNGRQAQQISGAFGVFAMTPFFTLVTIMKDPNGHVAVALSLFPLTAPMISVMRMSGTTIPTWQLITAISLILLALLGSLWLVTTIFRTSMLLYGQSFTQLGLKRFRPLLRFLRGGSSTPTPRVGRVSSALSPANHDSQRTSALSVGERASGSAPLRNVRLVARREFLQQIRSRAFIITTIGLPAMLMGIWILSGMLGGGARSSSVLDELAKADRPELPVGYVDGSGFVQSIPPGIPRELFIAFPDQAAASLALKEERIGAYYLLSSEYHGNGEVKRISPRLPLVPVDKFLFEWVLAWNLMPGQSIEDVARIREPFDPQGLQFVPAGDRGAPRESKQAPGMAPFIVVMVIMMPLFMAGGYLLQGLAQEKENRVIEILLVSLRPRQLLAGKLAGLGAVTMVQFGVWLLIASLMMTSTGVNPADSLQSLDLSGSKPAIIAAFAAGGFLLYATLMAGLGAVAPNIEGTRMWSFFISAPMTLPLILWPSITDSPSGPLAVALSILPFSSPVGMLMRLTATSVREWEVALSLALLATTSLLMLLLASKLFRASTLLSGQPLSAQRFWKAIVDS